MNTRTYIICLIFITIEVMLYNSSSVFLVASTIIAFLFILYNFILDKKVGLTYYIAFTLLSFGSWSYIITETPNNFWGLRFFGISLNISISLALLAFILLGKQKIIDSKYLKKQYLLYVYLFFIGFVGLINTAIGVNYTDNFFADLSFIITIIVYNFFISIFKKEELFSLFKGLILISIYGMILSYILGVKFEYAEGFSYILINALGFIIPFSFFLFVNYYSKKTNIFISVILLYLIFSGSIFMSGKLMVISIISFLWVILKYKKNVKLYASLILALSLSTVLSSYLDSYINSNAIIKYKSEQIRGGILNVNQTTDSKGSFGNILAEFNGINEHFNDNFYLYLTGKGIGAGLPDYKGLLSRVAGSGGYKIDDLSRNDFHGMHISFLDVFLKGGALWGLGFLIFTFRYFNSKDVSSFILFVMLFTVYYTTKEMLLLTFILYRYEYLKKING